MITREQAKGLACDILDCGQVETCADYILDFISNIPHDLRIVRVSIDGLSYSLADLHAAARVIFRETNCVKLEEGAEMLARRERK